MRYRTIPQYVEALTFDEFVQYGIESGAELHNGMPWSFKYKGYPITHENDDCYIIPGKVVDGVIVGESLVKFERGDMLVDDGSEGFTVCSKEAFDDAYEPLA